MTRISTPRSSPAQARSAVSTGHPRSSAVARQARSHKDKSERRIDARKPADRNAWATVKSATFNSKLSKASSTTACGAPQSIRRVAVSARLTLEITPCPVVSAFFTTSLPGSSLRSASTDDASKTTLFTFRFGPSFCDQLVSQVHAGRNVLPYQSLSLADTGFERRNHDFSTGFADDHGIARLQIQSRADLRRNNDAPSRTDLDGYAVHITRTCH
jgi:hypothetical protein